MNEGGKLMIIIDVIEKLRKNLWLKLELYFCLTILD